MFCSSSIAKYCFADFFSGFPQSLINKGLTPKDVIFKMFAWQCIEIFQYGFQSFVDKMAKQYHIKMIKPFQTSHFLHCKIRCFGCKIIHNKNDCAQRTFLHTRPTYPVCLDCDKKTNCPTCQAWYCTECGLVYNCSRNTGKCMCSKLACCRYCKKIFCTSCTNIFCEHIRKDCELCDVKHCQQTQSNPPRTHSTKCAMTKCETCESEYCKLCKKRKCSACVCSVDPILAKHQPQKCPLKNDKSCNCKKIYDAICNDHIKKRPMFESTDPTQWQTSYWEVAKCFLTNGKPPLSATESDVSDLLNLCSNNREIHQILNNKRTFKEV